MPLKSNQGLLPFRHQPVVYFTQFPVLADVHVYMARYKKSYKLRCFGSYDGVSVRFLVVPVFIWNGQKRGDIDEFVVPLAVSNNSLQRIEPSIPTRGESWTEIAHSDHNPTSGHDIYDSTDTKQFHVDVNHPHRTDQYVKVYRKLYNGNPPKPVGKAANAAKKLLVSKKERFLEDFLL